MEGSKLPKPSGLRPPQTKLAKPLNELEFNRLLSKAGSSSSLKFQKHPLSRRSKSVADLKTVMNRPRFVRNTTTKEQETKPQTSKTAQKRGANQPHEEIKPKIVKQAKIPDWDYKARFNQLREKHNLLNEQCKKHLSKLEESEDLEKKYNAIQEQHNKLEQMHAKLLSTNKEQSKENTELKSRVSELCIQIEEKRALQQNFDELVEKDKIKSQQIEELLEKIKYMTSICDQFIQLQVEQEKLKNEHNTLKTNYEKILKENGSLYINLDMETTAKKELSDQIAYLKQDIYDGEFLRRRLHNSVQDLKGNIRVFCRVRPPINSEESERLQCLINYMDERSLEIRKSRESVSTTSGKQTDLKAEFSFDKVFEPGSSQEEIFEDLSQLVQSALDGYDVCVFAYGQTGSGKTYTMHGGESLDEAGMIPRTVDLIFNSINTLSRAGWLYEVKASFLEIYNETVRDLLNPNCAQNLDIRYNEGKGTTVTNLTIQPIKSADDLKNGMIVAQRNRAVAATDFNEHSSRSHSVTKIYLHGVNDDAKISYTGSINLVDLAGSESAKTSSNERLVETKNINKSLSCLGSVMLALYNKEKHIPYRNSKLTYLLQSSLGGNSKTLMVVNIAPFEECYAESINSLRFAAKVKEVKMSVKRNKVSTK